MTLARATQRPLFEPTASERATRRPLAPPHATADDMARKREVTMHLVAPSRRVGWINRPVSTPIEALSVMLPETGRNAAQLQAVQGADPDDIEIRLTAKAAGDGPLHMLCLVSEGLTFDECRKALADLARRGL